MLSDGDDQGKVELQSSLPALHAVLQGTVEAVMRDSESAWAALEL